MVLCFQAFCMEINPNFFTSDALLCIPILEMGVIMHVSVEHPSPRTTTTRMQKRYAV